MKKLLAIASAGLVALTLTAAFAPAASAARPDPTPKISQRVSISKDCTVTQVVSWSGAYYVPGEFYFSGGVVGFLAGYGATIPSGTVAVPTPRGRMTVTYTGEIYQGTNEVHIDIGLGGSPVTDEDTKFVGCRNFNFVGAVFK